MIRKLLLLTMAAMCLCASKSAAVTTDDLDGKVGALVLYGNPAQYGFVSESIPGYFEKVNNTTLKFHNFYGGYDIQFTLSANKLSFVVGTTADRYDFWPTDGTKDTILNFYKANLYDSDLQTGKYYYDTYTNSTSYNTFTSTTYAEFVAGTGFYRFQFNFPLVIEEWTTDPQDCLSDLVYNGMDIFVVDVNAKAIDNLGREYLTGYNISGSSIMFNNFFNVGVRYINQTSGQITSAFGSSINGTISGTNITVPYMEVSGVVDFKYDGWTSNGYTATAKSTSQYLNQSNFISSDGRSAAITGKRVTNKSISHLTFDNNWAKDDKLTGSSARTVTGEYLEMGRIVYPQYYYYAYSLKQRTTDASKTYIYGKNAEVTHKASITVDKKGYGPASTWENPTNVLWVKGSIVPEENAQYIKEYELYVVADKVTSVTTANNDNENGIKNSMNISDRLYWTGYTGEPKSQLRPLAVGEDNDADLDNSFDGSVYHFNRLVTEEQLLAAGLDPGSDESVKNFTIYAKAIYKPETGLTPTFHALTNLDNIFTTGVESIVNDNEPDAPAVYYNLNGVQMNGDALTPGIYIRRQGNTTEKVVIR